MHASERSKTSSTARLLELVLPDCQIIRVGVRGAAPGLDLKLSSNRTPLLLFPDASAPVLTRDFLKTLVSPPMLVVPDGTWRQAKRIAHRQPELLALRRVQLPPQPPSNYRLRRQGREGGVCTAEAVARALGVTDGAQVETALLEALDQMVARIMWSRTSSQAYPPTSVLPEGQE